MKDVYQDCFFWLLKQPYIEIAVRRHLNIQADRDDLTQYLIEALKEIVERVKEEN